MHVRRAKIVCTLGPASDEQSIVDDLVHAGMDVARLNFSHGTHADHAERIQRIRRAAANVERPVAILQDLCGPKIRAGHFPGGHFDVPTDSRVALVEARGELAYPGEIPITYEGLVEDLEEGDEVLLDDGRVTLRIVQKLNGRVEAVAVAGGPLRDRVGVHLPSRRVRLSALTEKDKADLSFGLGQGVDYVALSFVRSGDDVRLVREICEAWGRPTPIIAKIETPQAIENLEDIIVASDAVMVARGDLGVEHSPERVPVLQREILGLSRVHQRPVIVATEMLQSMVTATRPTRAEASDVATAVFDGTDAVMLSQETASGAHPVLAARMMARIIQEAEGSRFYSPPASGLRGGYANVAEAVARNACDIAAEIGARVLVTFTESGNSARYVSKARPVVPIVAFSPNDDVLRRLALLWGVLPCPMEKLPDSEALLDRANVYLLAGGYVSPGDKVVIVFGAPVGVSGTTNTIHVRVVG